MFILRLERHYKKFKENETFYLKIFITQFQNAFS